MYNDNGDLVTEEGRVFRQIGWQINGGPKDGLFVPGVDEIKLTEALTYPHGGYSPVYIEVGE